VRVLLAEDEPTLRSQLATALRREGYAVDEAGDGSRAEFLGATEPYDAVILDLGLPVRDGLSVLRRWRSQDQRVPVLVLTARDRWHEKVDAIDSGADDYVTKPFHMAELCARLRALIRRTGGHASSELRSGRIRLEQAGGRVWLDDQPVELTAHEYRVLAYLMHRAGHAVSQGELADHMYGLDGERDSNTIEVFVRRLRRKLGQDAITTLRGLGYRMEPTP
jgi:two-component system OmpR family response regulator